MYILSSVPSYPFPHIKYLFYAMRLISYGLVALKFILDVFNKKYSVKELIIVSIIGIYLLHVSYATKTIGYIVYYIYVIVGKDVNYKKIIKTALISFSICVLIVVLFSKTGILEDQIHIQGKRNRHTFGFYGATYLPSYFMFIVLYYAYIRKHKIKLLEIMILLLINIFIYVMTNTKSAFALTSIAIISLAVLKHIKPLRVYYSFYKYVTLVSSLVVPIITIIISFAFNPNVIWMARLNRLLTGRLLLSKKAFDTYNISLLARYIPTHLDDGNYIYIDSSYVRCILIFGVVFFFLALMALVYYAYLINKKQDIYMFVIFMILIIRFAFDAELFGMSFNYFLFLLSYRELKVLKYE